ncbi:MAG: cell division protein FtsQ/DivIB [Microvirgula sp.]
MWDNHKALNSFASFLFGAALLMSLVAGGYWIAHSSYFPVRKIRIDGALKHVTPEQLRLVAESELKGTFFTLNLDATREAFEKLPWVRRAVVRRQWPDQLEIVIDEHRAVARWGESGLLSSQGEWFDAASSESLPMVEGPAGSEKDLVRALADAGRLLAPASLRVAGLKLSERRAWDVMLSNGVQLRLGHDDVEGRMARFVAVWQQELVKLPYRIEYVDLRYPNGFAVRMPDYKPGNVLPKKPAA